MGEYRDIRVGRLYLLIEIVFWRIDIVSADVYTQGIE